MTAVLQDYQRHMCLGSCELYVCVSSGNAIGRSSVDDEFVVCFCV